MTVVGVISDTHGLLRPATIEALRGCKLIIHAGDVGSPLVLEKLREIAPAVAVRGNVDTQPWAATLPATEIVTVEGHNIYVLHDRSHLTIDPVFAGCSAVVFGHSHRPLIETYGGVVYINPGSAGPRRFQLPITVARLCVSGQTLEPEIIPLVI
jgi:uncharacterized protein